MIWILGSSIVKRASDHVRGRPIGANLGLERHGCSVTWIGHPGLVMDQAVNIVHAMLGWSRPPAYLVIHCGGNDIGTLNCYDLRHYIKDILSYIMHLLPDTIIVWSSILPRFSYRFCPDTVEMEKVRSRVNRSVIRFVVRNGGRAIKYPDFQDKHPGLYCDDVHLSYIGNDLFINSLQGAFETFLRNHFVPVYPHD